MSDERERAEAEEWLRGTGTDGDGDHDVAQAPVRDEARRGLRAARAVPEPCAQALRQVRRRPKELALVQPDGRVHESIRNIVLSAFEGEGLEMHMVSPVAK